MKKMNYFKITITSMAIIGTVSLSTITMVSCGKNTQPPSKQTWDQFVSKAEAETLSNIVNNANPAAGSWKNLPDNDLTTDGDFVVNKPTITIKIKSVSMKAEASFSITAPDNNSYKVGNWGCSKQPPPPSNQWNVFKAAASAETPAKLLMQAKTTDAYKKFHWIGNPTQQKWQTSQAAEFDIYGGSGLSNDPYKGMAGTPIISESNKTITTIISIKGKNGSYDSDPIKAVISDKGNSYELSDWVFSQDQQLQSAPRYQKEFNNAWDSMDNMDTKKNDQNWGIWTAFIANNFIPTSKDNNHTSDTSLSNLLSSHDVIEANLLGYIPPTPENNIDSMSTINIKLWYGKDDTHEYKLTINSFFTFKDQSNKNVGSAFNFNWKAAITQIPDTK